MKKSFKFFATLLLWCTYGAIFSGNPGPYVDLSVSITDKSVVFLPGSVQSVSYLVQLSAYEKRYDSSTTVFYLSKDRQLDNLDFRIGQQPAKYIPPFGSTAHVIDLEIADSIPEGPYYLIAKADGLNNVQELYENNNGFSVPAYVGVPDVDLMVEILDSALTAYQYTTLPIRYREINNGNTAAHPHINSIYLSKDTTIDFSDYGLLEHQIPTYEGSKEFQIDATLWNSVLPGAYNLIIISDISKDNIESNESNNRSIIPVQILAANVDLSIKPLVTKLVAVKESVYTIPYRIFNHGDNTVTSVLNRYFISKDSLISADDYGFSGIGAYTINAHDSTDGTESRNLFRNEIAAGDYYIIIETDYSNLIKETDENNNTTHFKFKLLDRKVNAKVLKGTAPIAINVGTSYETVFKVLNDGTIPLSPNLAVYFSKDSVYDSQDILLSNQASSYLAPGEQKEVAFNFSTTVLAGLPSGKYYLLHAIDPLWEINEDNRSDNFRSYPVTLSSSSVAVDLKTSIVNITESGIVPGSKQKIKILTENTSSGAITQPTTLSLFLSKTKVLEVNNAYALQDLQIQSLNAYEKVTNDVIVDIPSTVAAGAYYVIAVADYTHVLSETNEDNNAAARPVTVVPAVLDFAVFQPILSKSWAKPNDRVEVSISFRNVTNTVLKDSIELNLLLTDNPSLPLNALLLDKVVLATKANTHQTYQTSFVVPQNLAFKKYYVVALLGYQGRPLESNTQNNRAYAVLDVKSSAARQAAEDFGLEMSVAPNPTEGDFYIHLNDLNDGTVGDISVTNTLGETVKSMTSVALKQNMQFDIAELPKGCYLLQITNGQQLLTQKIYKQ